MNDQQRQHFDGILDLLVAELPADFAAQLDELPLIVEDEPDPDLLRDVGLEPGEDDLCGLHCGVPLTERGLETNHTEPDCIMLFRGPIIRLAEELADEENSDPEIELWRQVCITLLHELGHHYGLEEDNLDMLGYA